MRRCGLSCPRTRSSSRPRTASPEHIHPRVRPSERLRTAEPPVCTGGWAPRRRPCPPQGLRGLDPGLLALTWRPPAPSQTAAPPPGAAGPQGQGAGSRGSCLCSRPRLPARGRVRLPWREVTWVPRLVPRTRVSGGPGRERVPRVFSQQQAARPRAHGLPVSERPDAGARAPGPGCCGCGWSRASGWRGTRSPAHSTLGRGGRGRGAQQGSRAGRQARDPPPPRAPNRHPAFGTHLPLPSAAILPSRAPHPRGRWPCARQARRLAPQRLGHLLGAYFRLGPAVHAAPGRQSQAARTLPPGRPPESSLCVCVCVCASGTVTRTTATGSRASARATGCCAARTAPPTRYPGLLGGPAPLRPPPRPWAGGGVPATAPTSVVTRPRLRGGSEGARLLLGPGPRPPLRPPPGCCSGRAPPSVGAARR